MAGKYVAYLYDIKESLFYIKFEVVFDVTDTVTELANRQEILLNISKLARTLEIAFAFPTHTLHIDNSPEGKGRSSHDEPNIDDLKRRVQDFFNEDNTL
jgi:MscS family membrane protein